MDVLVVGAGGAGLIAARAASEAGARVAVISASRLGQACNTAASGGGFMMSTEAFPAAEHVRLTLEAGRHLSDPALVRVLCQEANPARLWLESRLGQRCNRKDDGQGYWFPGGGAGLFRALARLVKRTPRIRLWEETAVVRLALESGRCVGALARRGGGPLAVRAGAVVLATGGYAGIYARHDNPGTPVGAGIALGLEAGAAVRDMEFVQFYPLGLAERDLPTFMAFRPFPPQARVRNAAGESLSEKHLDTDDLNEAVGRHRDRFSQLIEAESQRGPVVLDLTRVDWSRAERWFSLRHLKRYDFPWETRPARVAPLAHHTMGGLWVDGWGQTTVPGLYAVGEVAAGAHGANRLGSNSLTECLVFGRRVGGHAARAAAGFSPPAFGRRLSVAEPSPSPAALRRLQRLCWAHLGLEREERGLQAAQAALEDEFAEFKLDCARRVAQAVAAFALRRCESRGAHLRADFPDERPDWQSSTLARWGEAGLRLE